MDSFFGLFLAMGCNSMFFDNWSPDFDIIGALPLEVAIIILRKLDGKSLLNAARVSTKWFRIIKFDRTLRKTVREELARQRQEKLKRQISLCEAADASLHFAAFYPSAKKPRRQFEKSVRTKIETTVEKPTKRKTCSTTRTQLRKLR